MDVTKKNLNEAAEANLISTQQVDPLYAFLVAQSDDIPRFTFTHVLYYLGGLIAISAMTLFMTLGWESFGGAGIFVISAIYAGIGLKITNVLSHKHLVIPAGVCATFVVCLTPLAIYGLQQWLGVLPEAHAYRDFHQDINWY